jgi:ABC-type Fe3+/spermidine/putrescine transport system ATPase subunit
MANHIICCHNLSHRYDETPVIEGFELCVNEGEFVALLGRSGSGKTTLLRLIAGFERPTQGTIEIAGRLVAGNGVFIPPEKRRVGMVFQDYALFPHLTVLENIRYGLRDAGADKRAQEVLELVGLDGLADRMPGELSGGQQQRVALARALAPEPPVLLLDEPLSNLDAALRERTRAELRALLKEVGITAVFVTHDQEEAFHLSDRIAILDRGRLQQVGTPEELYHQPVNAFVAAFVGQANFLEGRLLERRGSVALVEVAGSARWEVELGGGGAAERLRVMSRPEALRLTPAPAEGDAGALPGRVVDRRFAGGATYYRVLLDGGEEIIAAITGRQPELATDRVGVELLPGGTARAYPHDG